ncbi:PAS domain S-box protein [Roseomonas sp. NAR14]|uniref:histidine kinase n=1 Tax=Roseomonas acroporae TaxID=2937791 RepID=A0A9X1Y706_9PROT|nr:PAS domain-containing sensor histidine kinase [Roseomonas acroporae]MCK8784743.1 PAS domain S-box protein [Roseomonas acroporae]
MSVAGPPLAPSPAGVPPVFPAGGGRMGALIRGFDWSATGLGVCEDWPPCLRTALHMVLHATAPMALFWGPDGVLLYNDGYAEVAGIRHPGMLGLPVCEGWPETAAISRRVIEAGMDGRPLRLRNERLVVRRDDGSREVWLNLAYSPVLDESHRPAGVLAVVEETTRQVLAERQRLLTEAALRDATARLQAAFDAETVIGTWIWEIPENRVTADARFARSFSLDPETVTRGMPIEAFTAAIHPDDRAGVQARIARVLREGGPYRAEYRLRRSGDDWLWVEASGHCELDAQGRPDRFPGVLIDVSARRGAEAALRESERRFRLMADSAPALIWATDPRGRLIFANRRHETVFGLPTEAMLNEGWRRVMHEEDTAPFLEGLAAAAASRAPFRSELRVRDRHGALRWMCCEAAPRLDGAGNFAGYTGVGIDVTEARLAAEALEDKVRERTGALQAAEETLRQAQKMEAVGQLTGGIAHDFNNLLTGIGGSLERMRARLAQGRTEDLPRYIAAAQAATERAASLTHRLLAFARRQTLDPRPTDVNRLVAGMEELIRRSVGPAVTVEVAAAGDLWPALCDANQLENALLNLAVNARDAMPEGGRLTIGTANLCLDSPAEAARRDMAPGCYVVLCVSDSGTGMTPEVAARAFDPFFTTKPLGLGTGLGLSMIYGFARQSGGQVRLCSEPGRGTTVRLYLPRHTGEAVAAEAPPEDAPAAGGGETVLVVDDEAMVRTLLVEALREHGYVVLEAGDAASGLRLLRSGTPVDLLVTDVGLPGGMNGRQFADAARVSRAGLRVLFVTGYAEKAAIGNDPLGPGMQVMTKPFALATLIGRIRQMLRA